MPYASPLDEPPLSEYDARREICAIGRRAAERGYVEANAGNISYRLADGRIVATPTMIAKGMMQPEDLVVLDAEGAQLSGERRKTSEILVHLQIFRHRPDVRCVIHTHAPHATAFAITGKPLPRCVHPEQEVNLGEVPIAPYQTPGTQAVADSLLPFIRDYNVFLLGSHGLVAAGGGVTDAWWKTEIVESYCRLIILSEALGGPVQLTAEQMNGLLQLKKTLGLPDKRIGEAGPVKCDGPVAGRGGGAGPGGSDGELAAEVTRRVVERLGQEGHE